jgi:hypothetical protein
LQVRARARELQKTLDEVVNTLRFQPDKLAWNHILDKYAVINSQVFLLAKLWVLRPVHPCTRA